TDQRASGKGEMPLFAAQKRRIRHNVEYLDSVATATGVLNTILRQSFIAMKIVDRLRHMLSAKEANTSWMIIGVSLWLATVCNYSLWAKISQLDSGPDYSFILAFSLIITGLGVFTFACLAWGKLLKPVLTAFVLMAASGGYFMQAYGIVIDANMITNVLQTDKREAFDLLNLRMILTVAAFSVPALWIIWRTERGRMTLGKLAGQHMVLAALGSMLAVLSLLLVFQTFASTMRNHKEIRYLINPFNSVYALGKVIAKPFEKNNAVLVKIGEDAVVDETSRGATSPIVILIVGETARADHLGVNGYARDTTPLLSARDDILSFQNAWSCGTSTAESLPCMFSHLGKEEFFDRASNYENMLDVLNRAGVSTTWIDNQSGCKGVCARTVTETMPIKNDDANCYSDGCFDIVTLKSLSEKINEFSRQDKSKGIALMVHQMGSHGPAYYKRSSSDRKKYFPECMTSSLQSCARDEVVNAYDNSIVETDYFISNAIEWIRKEHPDRPVALMYVSDHGESLGERNIYLHGLPYTLAPDAQKRIPWIVWFSTKFKEENGMRGDCLRVLKKDINISHDNYFHTALGLLEVKSQAYREELDLFSQCRKS
ncbi:phosphoethanolamine transferase, partial [Pseudomonas aeruginosa]|uniref:phosphoethanolamine transferase n=1 Tax=Pseudomonas aeruginosa TaxID=287 RepID=UPI001BD52C6D